MKISFSFIIPVFNRPDEVEELLSSLLKQTYSKNFEIVIVEDGSTISCEDVVANFKEHLTISYFKKPNSGPGDSRNFGMERALGTYFIILDSDCILPPQYLLTIDKLLSSKFVHCFGGPDAAHESFSSVQKAINYTMTSFLTTGGIRGNKNALSKFQPRSFNMGISKELFTVVGGFGNIHPGEDPDLTIRIWNKGYKTSLFTKAFVYHKRRIDWQKFYVQVTKFGMVRPILNLWHPQTRKITYWFPSLFMIGFVVAWFVLIVYSQFLGLYCYGFYFGVLFVDALVKTRSIKIATLALWATLVQFIGYGYGFIKSTIFLNLSTKEPNKVFPKLFFK